MVDAHIELCDEIRLVVHVGCSELGDCLHSDVDAFDQGELVTDDGDRHDKKSLVDPQLARRCVCRMHLLTDHVEKLTSDCVGYQC